MKRVATSAALLAVLVLLSAGAAGGAPAGKHGPTKLTVWVGWSAGHELTAFKKLAAEYQSQHKDVSLSVVGGITDTKIVAAIRAGNAPDVVSSFNSYNVGVYCGTKGWIDLAPLLKQSNITHCRCSPTRMASTTTRRCSRRRASLFRLARCRSSSPTRRS